MPAQSSGSNSPAPTEQQTVTTPPDIGLPGSGVVADVKRSSGGSSSNNNDDFQGATSLTHTRTQGIDLTHFAVRNINQTHWQISFGNASDRFSYVVKKP
jgi:hypothetical protein